ncbi:MAG: hypothetical protein GVY24_05255 [Planctomycetes bacterium]|jgi:hypothetical protein|nr:hypothetical protein [Planctomycetota bacterium]
MSDSAQLLRMLEPAVRPVPQRGADKPRATAEPFESRSFESLLGEAQRTNGEGRHVGPGQDASADQAVAEATPKDTALGPLTGLGTIENATLRQLIAQHHDSRRTDTGD